MIKYLVTGATGYVGSMLVKMLVSDFSSDNREDVITVLVRNKEKAKKLLPDSVRIIEADLTDTVFMQSIQEQFHYIIHFAAITKSSEMVKHPIEVTQSIVNATQNVMELAMRCRAESVMYVSSMEVYGAVESIDERLRTEEESNLGRVDILSARSCYPLAKRMAENISYCYYKENNLPVKIVRLAQVFGKGVLENETRVFAQFARCVIEKKDIILHTQGKSYGNYCEIEDALDAILLVLHRGNDGEVYNVVNEECTMKIYEMAKFVAKNLASDEISVKWDVPKENIYGYAADTGLRLSAQKLRSLGWKPKKGMLEMYEDLINDERKWIG